MYKIIGEAGLVCLVQSTVDSVRVNKCRLMMQNGLVLAVGFCIGDEMCLMSSMKRTSKYVAKNM